MPRHRSLKSYIEKLLSSEKRDKIKSIVLHGSMARGDYDYSSDVDLLIIVSEESKGISERIYEYSEYSDGWVEPLVYTGDEAMNMLNDFNPLILNALKDGVTLFDDGFWAGLKKKFEEMEYEGKLKRRGDSWIIKVVNQVE
ncbi:MAG: nucleotidyltransferase domain-containing protein [Candidatus Bathyarchaeia archaeon]